VQDGVFDACLITTKARDDLSGRFQPTLINLKGQDRPSRGVTHNNRCSFVRTARSGTAKGRGRFICPEAKKDRVSPDFSFLS
jgi:hypothetical protein